MMDRHAPDCSVRGAFADIPGQARLRGAVRATPGTGWARSRATVIVVAQLCRATVARQLRESAYLIVLLDIDDAALSTPALVYATTVKYHVPAVRLSITKLVTPAVGTCTAFVSELDEVP